MFCLNQNRNTKQQWMIVSDVFCPYIWLDHGTNYNSELTHINLCIIAQTQTSAIGHARRPPTVFSGNCVPTVFAKPIAFVPVSPVFAHGARLSSICQHLEYELTIVSINVWKHHLRLDFVAILTLTSVLSGFKWVYHIVLIVLTCGVNWKPKSCRFFCRQGCQGWRDRLLTW